MVYIVTFSVNSEESRNKVREELKKYSSYCPIHKYCWAVETDEKSTTIRDKIKAVLQPEESVFVIRSGTEAAWYNSYGEKNNNWLKEKL